MSRGLTPIVARSAFVVLIALAVAYLAYIRPANMRWGASDVEVTRPMPGDWIVRDATFNATRAVTIDARPDQVWPWIVQMGTGRGGFYGYDWIDRAGLASAEDILPQYQSPEAGDVVPSSTDARTGYLVKGFQPNHYMLWLARTPRLTWCWELRPIGPDRTRLVTRVRFRHPWRSFAIFTALATDVGDTILMPKCMLGIKARAEALARKVHKPLP